MDPSFTGAVGDLLKQAASRTAAWLKRRRRLLQYLFSGTILLFLGLYVYRHAHELSSYHFSLELPSLILASVLLLVVGLINPLAWRLILRTFLHETLSWPESLRIWYVSQVSRYLPGSVWNYVSRVYLCGERNIPTSKAILSMVLEIVMNLLAQAIVFLASLAFWPGGQGKNLWVLVLLPAGLVLLHPRVFNGILSLVASRSGLEVLPNVALRPDNVGGTLALFTFGVSLASVGFFFFAHSLYPLSLGMVPVLAGILTLSFIVGFLAPFAPYGLGVREGLMTLLLSQYIPPAVAVVISLASRLWLTVIELLALSLSLGIQRILPDNPKGLSE